jgi:hypothetical protein
LVVKRTPGTCSFCGQPGTVSVIGDKRVVVCTNKRCPAHNRNLLNLAQAALNLRAKKIGFGEFKRIVDTNTM